MKALTYDLIEYHADGSASETKNNLAYIIPEGKDFDWLMHEILSTDYATILED